MAANKDNNTYSVVSYFSGCGGLDLGFRGGFRYHDTDYPKQPFNIIAAYDFEKHCVETYNSYFGENSAAVADLSQIDVATVPAADILIGGFPCQEFSSCGPLGGLESQRGRLYQTLITYMNTYHPKVVVGENVINLERMENGNVIQKIVSDLQKAGYTVEVNAFRRVDKGTKCLFAPNDIAKRYATEFRKGNREYFDDTKWWKAAQEEDQRQSSGGSRATTAVNTGETPSDDVSSYLNGLSGLSPTPSAGSSEATTQTHSQADGRTPSTLPGQSPVLQDSKLDELIQKSNVVNQLTGRNYKYGNTGSLNVRVYELTQGEIIQQGERRPCFFSSDGIDCDFVYDPAHPMLAQYPITPQALLLIYLAEKLKARDNVKDIMAVYSELVVSTMADSKVDRQSLQDRASSVFELLREKLKQALIDVPDDVMNCIHESAGEVEETITNLIQANPSLLQKFQEKQSGGFEAIEFVPPKTLYRLVERFPERTMDGAVFSAPYLAISLTDSNATNRANPPLGE